MADGPSLLQRQAIGNLMTVITKDHPTIWGNYLWEQMKGWNIIANSDISLYDYYYQLKHIPDWPKRSIVYTILMSWNYHHNLQALYDAINKLIYLKVCNATEYFLMQYMFNFLQYFSTVCKNLSTIQIEQNMFNKNMFTLRFWKDNSHLYSHGIIDIQFSPIGEDSRIAIVPWFSLIGEKTNHRYNCNTQSGIDELVNNEFVPLLLNEFAKKHCPWIYSNASFGYKKENLDRAIALLLSSLEYEDNNGGL